MRRRCFVLFLLLSAVYHSNLRPVASGDSLGASLIPFSVVLDGSITLDRFGPYIAGNVWYGSVAVHKTGDHWYSGYPIAGPVLASPLYLPMAFVPPVRRLPPATLVAVARIVEKVAAVTLAAATAIVLLLLLRRLVSERAAWLLTLVFALGTGNWSTSSQAWWQHTFGGLAIVGCLYAIGRMEESGAAARWQWLAGACAGYALATRPTNLALVPALALALWFLRARPAAYARAFVLPLLAGILTAAYNVVVFQTVRGGYASGLDGNIAGGLAGILFSPGRGLLIYTPVAIFALAAFAPAARFERQKHRALVAASCAFVLLQIAVIALWPVWWGGYCWGPRLLTEILAPVMVLVAIGLPALAPPVWKCAFAAAVVYGFLIQALGVYCYPKGHWDHAPVSVNDAPARLWNWGDNPIVRTVRGGVAWEPFAILSAAATGGLPAAAKKLQELGITAY